MGRVISIDQAACSGCRSCAELCPEGFVVDEEREVAVALDDADIAEGRLAEVLSACPRGLHPFGGGDGEGHAGQAYIVLGVH